MATDDRNRRMPAGELGEFHGSRFARLVAAGFDPGVLEDYRLQRRGALDDRIEFRHVGPAGNPELHAYHGPVAHAPVEFVEAGLRIIRIQIDESEGPVMPVTECLQDLIILLAQGFRTRIFRHWIPHVDADTV